MIKVDIYSSCWTPWKHPYYLLDGKKYAIYYGSDRYWLLNEKIYFGSYQSLFHWEVKLFVAERNLNTANMKNIGKEILSVSRHQLLHWGSNIREMKCFFPESNLTVDLETRVEKSWQSQINYYSVQNEEVGKVVFNRFSDIITGKVAQLFIDPKHQNLLPHLLGSLILTRISS